MSKKDFQQRSFIPSIHGFEEREERARGRYHPRRDGAEQELDEDGYIPNFDVKVVRWVKVYWFSGDNPKAKHLLGTYKRINEAQDRMKDACGGTRMYNGVHVDHWLLLWTDQFGENHYQRWSNDFSDMFPYGDDYAKFANIEGAVGIAHRVDPPIGCIPDAQP